MKLLFSDFKEKKSQELRTAKADPSTQQVQGIRAVGKISEQKENKGGKVQKLWPRKKNKEQIFPRKSDDISLTFYSLTFCNYQFKLMLQWKFRLNSQYCSPCIKLCKIELYSSRFVFLCGFCTSLCTQNQLKLYMQMHKQITSFLNKFLHQLYYSGIHEKTKGSSKFTRIIFYLVLFFSHNTKFQWQPYVKPDQINSL